MVRLISTRTLIRIPFRILLITLLKIYLLSAPTLQVESRNNYGMRASK